MKIQIPKPAFIILIILAFVVLLLISLYAEIQKQDTNTQNDILPVHQSGNTPGGLPIDPQ